MYKKIDMAVFMIHQDVNSLIDNLISQIEELKNKDILDAREKSN